uniref:transglutaminase family protein n=1 Tax=uncultured Sphingomonas sp. TaxID=158754 RepID=UPI0035CC154E
MTDSIAHLGLLDDEELTLDIAALELAALDHPEIELTCYVDTVTALADRLATVGGPSLSAMGRAEALSVVLAQEFGLGGDRETYDDSRNADLIAVLDRRRGLPVALSILYASAARRIGWSADILNTPGHVLMRLGHDTAPVIIDPFNHGECVTPAQVARLLRDMGDDTRTVVDQVSPMSNRMVLVRLLTNQATRAEASGDGSRALILYARITSIAPAYGHGWWERARLELRAGALLAARASLSAMLEMTRDFELRLQISAALEALAGTPS